MKRLSAFLLSLVLMLSLMPLASAEPVASGATPPSIPTTGDVWDGSIEAPTKIVQKDGVNYYEITKCSQLAYVAQTGGEWLGRNYLLANNLILNDVVLEWDEEGNLLNDTTTLHEWTPIGKTDDRFSGCFNGSNYTISGVFINSPSSYNIGLFGHLSDTREFICNLNVINSYIYGYTNVGGIVGNSAALTSVVLCQFNGFAIGENSIGGIAGYAFDTVKDCTNYGLIKGKNNVGGIAGQSYARFSSCANYGAVNGIKSVGGVVGFQNNIIEYPIENCYNTATITGESNVGGVVGSMKNGAITCCYSIGNVQCTVVGNNAGAIVGTDSMVWGNSNSIIGCYYLKTASVNANLFGCGGVTSADMEPTGFYAKSAAALKEQATFEGWDFSDTWYIDLDRNDGYPYLAMEDDLPGAIPKVRCYLDGSKLNWKVTGAPEGAILIAARYSNGRMTDLQTTSVTAGKSSGTFIMAETGLEYKVMLVDNTTYTPLCKAWISD